MPHDTDSQFKYLLRSPNQDTVELTKNPKGWEETTLTLKRSAEYGGIFSEFSFDLGFYANGGGKEFLDIEYENRGIDAIAFILVQYKCADGSFEDLFDGKFNFSKYSRVSDPVSENITNINIEQNDFSQIVLTRGDVNVDLKSTTTLDGSSMTAKTFNNYNVDLFSQPIDLVSAIGFTEAITLITGPFSLGPGNPQSIWMVDPFLLIADKLPLTVAQINVDEFDTNGGNDDFQNSSTFAHFHQSFFNEEDTPFVIFPITYTLTWRFKGNVRDKNVEAKLRSCDNLDIRLRYGAARSSATVVNLGTISSGWSTSAADFLVSTFDLSGTATIVISKDDFIWQYQFAKDYLLDAGETATAQQNLEWNWEIVELELSAPTLFRATESVKAPSSAIFEAYSQISESITDQTDGAFESTFYGRKNSQPVSYSENGCGSNRAVTEGTQIRGLINKGVNTNLNDLFFSCKAVDNVRLGVQDFGGVSKIVVEELSFFYDKTSVIFTANNIRDLNMTVDLEKTFNEAEFGFEKWEPESTNGILEINSTRKYELDVTGNRNQLVQKSKYIAAGYIIEEMRRQSLDTTTDTEFDNDMFFISLSRSVDGGGIPDQMNEPEDDENITDTSNVSNPELRYNYWLTPARCMLRWMNVLSPSIFRTAGAKVNFRFGTGNVDAEVEYFDISCDGDFTGANLPENSSIAWDNANVRQDEPLWIPEIYTFTYPVSFSEYKIIRNNIYKLIEFKDGNKRKWGWILDLGYDVHNKQGSFKLIRAFIKNA